MDFHQIGVLNRLLQTPTIELVTETFVCNSSTAALEHYVEFNQLPLFVRQVGTGVSLRA